MRVRLNLPRIMQVNQAVVDKFLMVLVPTQLTPGRIKATDRHLKFGVLGLNDDNSLDNVVDWLRVR